MSRPTEPTQEGGAPEESGSLSKAAAKGTGWTSIQGLLNKLATMAAMLLVSRLLSPDEYGMGNLVVAVAGLLIVMPPLVMGDVLITHQRRFRLLGQVAGRTAIITGVLTTVGMVVVAPLVALFYPNYAFQALVGLLLVISLRPLAESLMVLPLSRLRIGLRYQSIALIDGAVQLVATAAMVVLAWAHAGALAIVAPQVAAVVARAVCYRVAVRHAAKDLATLKPADHQRMHKRTLREFTTAGSAQYIHTLIGWVPVLVLGKLSTESETGFFGFSFLLANQATYVLSYQLGTVLQPIFGRLKHEPERQAAGFLRVVRAVGAIAVPASFLQAALAEPLFQLIFPAKWAPATSVFAVLCIGQAFYFAMAPAMALLKAQGRFKTFFVWQATQLAASLVLYPVFAHYWGAIGVSAIDTVVWGISVPVAVILGTSVAGGNLRTALAVFVAPWSTSVPIAAAAWGAWLLLRPMGTAGMVIALAAVGPAAFAISIWATRFSQPATWAELQPMLAKVSSKFKPLLRKSLGKLAGGGR